MAGCPPCQAALAVLMLSPLLASTDLTWDCPPRRADKSSKARGKLSQQRPKQTCHQPRGSAVMPRECSALAIQPAGSGTSYCSAFMTV